MSETLTPPDVWASFLAGRAREQEQAVQRYRVDGEEVWIKKATSHHAPWRYGALRMLGSLVRTPALMPVPHPGGDEAIATEVRRLRDLAARGVRVPLLLATQPDALLLLHLGRAGEPAISLAEELDRSLLGPPGDTFAVWRQGFAAIRSVHATGSCLSQAFARNLVRCPGGEIAFIDFEDDPQAVLPLADCQVRDVLCYLHSSALHLERAAAAPGQANGDATLQALRSWSYEREPAARDALRHAVRRLAWLRKLPGGVGRDVDRTRSAAALLARLRV